MKAWSSFYPDLLPHVPGCPDPVADHELRRASREFFRRTRAWAVWLDAVTVAAGTRAYDLDLPQDAQVVRLEKATVNGQPLNVMSITQLNTDIDTDPIDKPGLTTTDRSTFTLTEGYPDGALIKVRVSLMPTRAAYGIPDELFYRYSEDIVAGAKSKLMLYPKTDFYNETLAAIAGVEFEAAINNKAVDVWRGGTGKTPRARLRLC